MRVIGVDLAWVVPQAGRRANETGVVAVEPNGTIVDAGWTVGVDETVAWIERAARPDRSLVFVDAPLVVTNTAGQRACEREVGRRYGKWKVSANSTNLGSPRLAGVRLRERLEALGWRYDDGLDGPPPASQWLSECYPYTTIVGALELGFDEERPRYKRTPRYVRIAEFRPVRANACDELIRQVAGLETADPPYSAGITPSHPGADRGAVTDR